MQYKSKVITSAYGDVGKIASGTTVDATLLANGMLEVVTDEGIKLYFSSTDFTPVNQVYPAPTFGAIPAVIAPGQPSNLVWKCPEASAIHLDGLGVTGADGTKIVRPVSNTTYTLTVDYPDGSKVTKTVNVTADPTLYGKWVATYWDNKTMSGLPITSAVYTAPLSLRFPTGVAPVAGIGSDNYSTRFARTTTYEAATYQWTINADDGVQVWVDGSILIDAWKDQAPTVYTAQLKMTAGVHDELVAYYEAAGASTIEVKSFVVVTPPPPTGLRYLGVHKLGDAITQDYIPAALFIDNNDEANRVANMPNRIGIFRKWIGNDVLSPSQFSAKIPYLSPKTYLVMTNENDTGISRKAGESYDAYYLRRTNWEKDVVRLEYAKGVRRFCLLTESMGCPDFTNAECCAAIKKHYAPWYNSQAIDGKPVELVIDIHSYSPNVKNIYPAPTAFSMAYYAAVPQAYRVVEEMVGFKNPHIATRLEPGGAMAAVLPAAASAIMTQPWDWYSTRWRWLYWLCGFDPRIRNVVSTETGLDEGGVGGFPAHNQQTADVRKWMLRFMDISVETITIPAGETFAGTWASPFKWAVLFQSSASAQWAGYNVTGYLNADLGSDVWQR